jgi:hypothetical protein
VVENTVLRGLAVHYFNMHTEDPNLSQGRFGSIIFIFRMAGILFNMKKVSTLYAVYVVTNVVCFSTTYLCMCVDVYIHRNDLGNAMTTVRVLFTFTDIMWLFSYCRYVTTLASISVVL